MASVSREECRDLAHLARLRLTDEEADRFSEQLARILGHIEQLQAVDVEGVPEYLPDAAPPDAMRKDEVGPMLDPERVLQGTPSRRDAHVVVPKFKED